MSKPCKILKEVKDRMANGESIDDILPYHAGGPMDKDSYMELLALYLKHGTDPDRLQTCMNKLGELMNI